MASTSAVGKVRPLLTKGEVLRTTVGSKSLNPPKEQFFPVDLPTSVSLLAPQAERLSSYFQTLAPVLRDERVYVEARLRPNYLAASNWPKTLFGEIDARQVGTSVDYSDYITRTKVVPNEVTKRVILSVPVQRILELPALLRASQLTGSLELQADIKKLDLLSLPFGAAQFHETELDNEIVTYEAVINPAISKDGACVPASEQTLHKFVDYIQSTLGGEVVLDYVRSVGGLTFVPVRLKRNAHKFAHHFNPLRSLRPMPTFRPAPGLSLRGIQQAIPPRSHEPQGTAHTVGVFDGGIGKAQSGSQFFPHADVELTGSPEVHGYVQHGAAVVGAAMYGLVGHDEEVPVPHLRVESYRILPPVDVPEDLHCFWALDQIKAVVENGLHDVYNLSLGPQLPVSDYSLPNRWTSELDELAWAKQVLIVVAAGNDGQLHAPNSDSHRVQVPADMVNALSVGACNVPAPQSKWGRSPESSFGPGRFGARVSPSVVQYGGTAAEPMSLLTSNGSLRKDAGTSFAAPVVTHALSGLVNRLGSADPNTLRAFAIHFADKPRPLSLINEVGHGRAPLSFNGALLCGPDNIHVLYRDRIIRKQNLSYEIPIPAGYDGKLEVRVTLAYASPIDPSDSLEYTKASLDLTLRPNRELFSFSKKDSGEAAIKALLGSAEANAAQLRGLTPGRHPVSQPLTASEPKRSESWRRKEGKWETLRHYRFSLAEGEYLEPRIHMSYLAREAGVLTDSAPPIPFSIVVSVADTLKRGDLYDKVQLEYPVLVPVPPLQPRLQV